MGLQTVGGGSQLNATETDKNDQAPIASFLCYSYTEDHKVVGQLYKVELSGHGKKW